MQVKYQIKSKIPSAAKDRLNEMFIERDGVGYKHIDNILTDIYTTFKKIDVISDIKLKDKLICLLIDDYKDAEANCDYLELDMKNHFLNFIHAVGATKRRELKPTYIVYEPETLKTPSTIGAVKLTENAARKTCKRLNHGGKYNFTYDLLTKYKELKYRRFLNK